MSKVTPRGADACSPRRGSKSSDPDYEECIVTYIDILGFRDLLENRSAADIRQILSIFRRAAKPSELGLETDANRDRFESEVRMEVVSDAVVRVRTVHNPYQDGPLFWELLDLVHIQADCVHRGILVRGALTIDNVHLGRKLEGPLFGPGVGRAYEIERHEAVYPRIVVEEAVMERFAKDERLWREGHRYSDEAGNVGHLLTTDEAGLSFVDYLGAINQELSYYVEYLEFLRYHKRVVEQGLTTAIRGKVRRKYVWLKNYHNRQVREEMDTPNIDKYQPDLGGTLREALDPLVIA